MVGAVLECLSRALAAAPRHVLRHLGDREAMSLTRVDVEEYRRKRLEEKTRRGKAPKSSTLNREVALLKRIVSYAVECERLPHSTIAHVPMLEENNVRQRTGDRGGDVQDRGERGPAARPDVPDVLRHRLRLGLRTTCRSMPASDTFTDPATDCLPHRVS